MELRKEKSKLAFKRRESADLFADEPMPQITNPPPVTTPVRTNNRSEDEESPYLLCYTQEMREDVDVLWDYNSPQSKPRRVVVKKSKKKLELPQSPKVPLRRHPSNNNDQIKQDFCKLREELQALKAEIAKPDHEESLILSPREEEAFKITQDDHMANFHHIEEQPVFENDFDDHLNDDMDDMLLMCTQQVFNDIQKTETGLETKSSNNSNHQKTSFGFRHSGSTKSSVNPSDSLKTPKIAVSNCDTRIMNQQFGVKTENVPNNHTSSMVNKISNSNSQITVTANYTASKVKKVQERNLQDSEVFNDSFENVLSQMDVNEFDQLTQVMDIKQYKNDNFVCKSDKKSKVFPRSYSEDRVKFGNVQTVSGKVEWHRTQSFESYNSDISVPNRFIAQLSTEKLQEIERKRLQAKAKLEAKKKQDTNMATIPEIPDSLVPTNFREDIEKKRLQALAKLEAKRQQEMIEKKKQEALKRREESRKKNAAQVKSSLATRL